MNQRKHTPLCEKDQNKTKIIQLRQLELSNKQTIYYVGPKPSGLERECDLVSWLGSRGQIPFFSEYEKKIVFQELDGELS